MGDVRVILSLTLLDAKLVDIFEEDLEESLDL